MTIGARPCETIFGHRLEDVRLARGLTIRQFAEHCRVSQRSMMTWLLGDGEPLLGYAFKAALAIGYNVEDLADPSIACLPKQRRPDAPGDWTFSFKGSVCTTKFGSTFRAALQASGRTNRDFAAEIGVHRHQITAWCDSRSEPRLTTAMRAAEALGLSLHGLCEGEIVKASPAPRAVEARGNRPACAG